MTFKPHKVNQWYNKFYHTKYQSNFTLQNTILLWPVLQTLLQNNSGPNITRCDPESRGDLHDLLCRLLVYRITHQLADTTLPKITQLHTTEGKGDTHHQADSTTTNTTGMLTSDLQTQRCRRYASRLPCHKHWHHHQQHADSMLQKTHKAGFTAINTTGTITSNTQTSVLH